MTTFVFANNINTDLASSVSSSATTITLSSGANLPASIPSGSVLAITLNDAATQQIFEVVYATAISGTTLTIQRAQEGTTPQAWAAGDYVFSGPTAGQMENLQGAIDAKGNGTVTSVAVAPPAGFAVSGSPVTTSGTITWTFVSQNQALFLATPPSAAGVATWRLMAASDVNGALGYTAANAANVVNTFNGRLGAVTLSGADVDDALGYTAANDANVVHLAGTETITGAKTMDSVTIMSGALGVSGTVEADIHLPMLADSPYLFANSTNRFGMCNATTGITFTATSTAFTVSQPATFTSPLVGVDASFTPISGHQLSIQSDGTDAVIVAQPPGGGSYQNTSIYATSVGVTGSFSAASSITCTTMNATASDRRLKRNIRKFEPRPLHRSVPFVSYTLKENGWHGIGSVAQNMRKAAPEHVGEFDWHGKKRLSLNYAGAAYEEAMWAGLALDKALDRIKVLEKRLAALERRV